MLNGNFTVYQVGRSQYESVCSAVTADSKLCGYTLPELNYDENSANAYSQQNCVNGEHHSGSYNSKTLVCTDDAGEYEHKDKNLLVALCGVGTCLFAIIAAVCGDDIQNMFK